MIQMAQEHNERVRAAGQEVAQVDEERKDSVAERDAWEKRKAEAADKAEVEAEAAAIQK